MQIPAWLAKLILFVFVGALAAAVVALAWGRV